MNARMVVRPFVLMLISLISTPKLAVASTSDSGTLTVGRAGGHCSSMGLFADAGYGSGAFGSYSPTGLTGGDTVFGLLDQHSSCFGNTSTLDVTGFSSDPGSGWLVSVSCNGVTNSASSANYVYSAGEASWSWTTLFGFSSLANGTNVSCTIVHN
jgi:hypothetical protein